MTGRAGGGPTAARSSRGVDEASSPVAGRSPMSFGEDVVRWARTPRVVATAGPSPAPIDIHAAVTSAKTTSLSSFSGIRQHPSRRRVAFFQLREMF